MGEMPLGIRSLLGPITDLKSEDRIRVRLVQNFTAFLRVRLLCDDRVCGVRR